MYNYPYGDTSQLNLDWFLSKVREMSTSPEVIATDFITLPYDEDHLYLIGDYCYYNGVLYKSIANTSGEFDLDAWVETKIGNELINVNSDLANIVDELNNSTDNHKIKFIAGCIRQDANGWYILTQDAHLPIHLASVEVDNTGDIVVYFDFQGTKVCSVIAKTDETLSELYDCGTSVSGNLIKIRIWRKPYSIGGFIRFTSGAWDYSNSDFSNMTTASGVITATYAQSYYDLITQTNAYQVSVQANKGCVIMDEVTRTYIKFHMIDSSGNTVTSFPSGTEFYISKPINTYKVDANSQEFNLPNANIWILGLAITD